MSFKTLETKMHMQTFLAWKLDPRVSALVESTCFRWFLKLKDDLYRQDSNLLTALASMYDESQDHFVIGNPKMDIDFGLEDVLYITGLPIDGEQVSGFESENTKNTIMDHFKITEERAKSLMTNSGIDLSRLKKEFEEVPQENEIDLEPYFKAYLLFLLGVVILPNNSSSYSPMYLPLLGLKDVNRYAWGAAMLANMKEALEKVKKAEKITSLCGFSYALTVFALERFPDLRERCGSSPRYSLPSGFPLILGWMEALSKPNKDTKNVTSVEDYQKKLQEMKEKDVVWQPYKNRDLKLSKKYASQLPMVFSRTPCSCFNEGAYNRPDVCFKQLGLEKSQVKTVKGKIRKGVKLKLSKHKNKDWKSVKAYYPFVTEQWTKRYENFICEIARDELTSVPEGGGVASGGYSTCHSFHIEPERPYLVEEYEEAHSSEKERELPEMFREWRRRSLSELKYSSEENLVVETDETLRLRGMKRVRGDDENSSVPSSSKMKRTSENVRKVAWKFINKRRKYMKLARDKRNKNMKRARENVESAIGCCQKQIAIENDKDEDTFTIAQLVSLGKKYSNVKYSGEDSCERFREKSSLEQDINDSGPCLKLASTRANGDNIIQPLEKEKTNEGTSDTGRKAGDNIVMRPIDENNSSGPPLGFDEAIEIVMSPPETRQTCEDELTVSGSNCNAEKMTMIDDGIKEPEYLLQEEDAIAQEKARSDEKDDDAVGLIQQKLAPEELASKAHINELTPRQKLDNGDETTKAYKRSEDVGLCNESSYQKRLRNLQEMSDSIEKSIEEAKRNVAWLKERHAIRHGNLRAARMI